MPEFDTPEPIIADIEISIGQVRITASDRTDTLVEVRPSDPTADASVSAAERTRVELTGGRLIVRGPKNKSLAPWASSRGSIDVTVDLPAGSDLTAKGAADFLATGPLGECVVRSSDGDIRLEEARRLELKAANGEISVDRAAGPTEITASNGAVRIGLLDGPGTVKSSNGDIVLGDLNADSQLNTGNGDITIGRSQADVTAKSAYGRLQIAEVVRGTARLETGYGKARIGIAAGTVAWLDLHTKNGVVRNSLTTGDEPGDEEAVAEVHVHSNYGDIDVHRS